MNTKKNTFTLRVVLPVMIIGTCLFLQGISFEVFSQASIQEAKGLQLVNHTYTVAHSFKDASGSDGFHAASSPATMAIWEHAWVRNSVGLLILGLLFFAQRARMRKIQRLKSGFTNVINEKNEEISHQAKNIKLQAESNHDLKEACESLQLQLAQQTEKANRAERAKNSFLTMISYGVRTPLNGLLGTSALLMETNLTEEQNDYTKTIHNCGENLLTAVNDMFDYAKIESGEIRLEEKEFNLRRCVEDVMGVFSNKASEGDLDFVYRLGKNVPAQIVGDSFRLKQVLINLVANALKFTQQIEDIFIDIKLVSTENNLCVLAFDIHNTGVGIHYDSAVSMFKSFSKADYSDTNQYGGTGLGLANCENLVRLMGGSISMESHRGKGSTFSFEIHAKISQNPFQTNEIFDTESLEGKRVLLVDNHSNNLLVLKEQLEEWKMITTLAGSGYEAMKVLSENPGIDMVITDLKMPGFDGIQLGQAIKKFHPSLPIILLSPLANDHWKKDGDLFTSSIAKPIKQNSLYKHVLKGLQSSEKIVVEDRVERDEFTTEFSKQYPVRILIAEDNIINQKLTQRVLSKLGYKSTIAMNGREALDAINKNDYDMIFMDVQMPVLNGLETTIQIRQQDRLQPIIVAMTANTMTGDREDCLRAGMDDYISKPMNQSEMINMLKKWALQIKATRQQRFLAQA